MLAWLKDHDLAGTWADVAGLVGFAVTIVAAIRARSAAIAAKEAAEQARESIQLFDTIVDFTAAIATLEELKRLHRQENPWPMLPDRYAEIRKLLIALRGSKISLKDEQQTVIQSALTNLSEIERIVERSLKSGSPPKHDKFNSLISADIDSLLGVLHELKAERSEGSKS